MGTTDYIVNADGSIRGKDPIEHQYGERWVKCSHCGMTRPANKLCLYDGDIPNQTLPPKETCVAKCRDRGECNAYKIKREELQSQAEHYGL